MAGGSEKGGVVARMLDPHRGMKASSKDRNFHSLQSNYGCERYHLGISSCFGPDDR